jgi:hypothetical protein
VRGITLVAPCRGSNSGPTVKRPLTRIAYFAGPAARPLPLHGARLAVSPSPLRPRPLLDTLEPPHPAPPSCPRRRPRSGCGIYYRGVFLPAAQDRGREGHPAPARQKPAWVGRPRTQWLAALRGGPLREQPLEHAPRHPDHAVVLADLAPELHGRALGIPAGVLGKGKIARDYVTIVRRYKCTVMQP